VAGPILSVREIVKEERARSRPPASRVQFPTVKTEESGGEERAKGRRASFAAR